MMATGRDTPGYFAFPSKWNEAEAQPILPNGVTTGRSRRLLSEVDPKNGVANCPRCKAPQWMTGLPLLKPLGEVTVYAKPATWQRPPEGVSHFHASICGYTELQALNPLRIWEAWTNDA